MATERHHYPVMIYVLTVACALGLAAAALGIVDGWIPLVGGVATILVSLARLHVILNRRRGGGALTPPPA